MNLPEARIVAGNTSHTRPENRAFYPALDGLRAVAFFMVFFNHYDSFVWGWAGVDIFFVLSGFLITGILWDSRDDPHRARNFYVRRTLRIFPLYYGIMLGLLLLEPLVHWKWTWYWLIWPAYLGNIAPYVIPHFAPYAPYDALRTFDIYLVKPSRFMPLAFGHFWTLCVEEQFYLIWPWMVFFLRDRRKLMWICLASLPLCLGARILGLHALSPWMLDTDVLFHATPFRVDDLLLGSLLALVLRGPLAATMLRWSRWITPAAVIALTLALALPSHHALTYGVVITWGLTIIGLLSALLILLAIQPGSVVARALSFAPLRWLGRISYGAYVFHVILKAPFHYIGFHYVPAHQELVSSSLALVFTVLIAWLSFRFFESPFLNLKERWTIRPSREPAA